VIVVHDWRSSINGPRVRGILFYSRHDSISDLADNGCAGVAYAQDGLYRTKGLGGGGVGAAAVLCARSGAPNSVCQSGVTIGRRDRRLFRGSTCAGGCGPGGSPGRVRAVTLKLVLTQEHLPDADSSNVIAMWPGRENRVSS